jgi:sulfate/thiosulfate transport system permease protein
MSRYVLRYTALLYLLLLVAAPVGMVFYRAFEHGIAAAWDAVTTPPAQHAFYLTVIITLIAVPANAIFGVLTALLLARREFPGKRVLNAAVDLPFAVSPVIVGLALILVWGRNGWFHATGIIFAVPGMVLATIFVSLPFVVREVVPVLQELGTEQEEAAATLGAGSWQTFWRVTLPAIRWAVGYGVVLTTARALGEFGAVSVVSGRIAGRTETLTLRVQQQFENFNLTGAYAASALLALIAIAVLVTMTLLERRRRST